MNNNVLPSHALRKVGPALQPIAASACAAVLWMLTKLWQTCPHAGFHLLFLWKSRNLPVCLALPFPGKRNMGMSERLGAGAY